METRYGRDAAGRVLTVSYSDATPGVTNEYTRAGLLASVTDASGERTFEYDDRFQLVREDNLDGTLEFERVPETGQRSLFRLTAGDAQMSVGYGYDDAGRLSWIGQWFDGGSTQSFEYSYLANSDLPAGLVLDNGMSVTRDYDPALDRLRPILGRPGRCRHHHSEVADECRNHDVDRQVALFGCSLSG